MRRKLVVTLLGLCIFLGGIYVGIAVAPVPATGKIYYCWDGVALGHMLPCPRAFHYVHRVRFPGETTETIASYGEDYYWHTIDGRIMTVPPVEVSP